MNILKIKDKSILMEKFDDVGYDNIVIIDEFLPRGIFDELYDDVSGQEHRWQCIRNITGDYYDDIGHHLADNLGIEEVPNFKDMQLISVPKEIQFKKMNEINEGNGVWNRVLNIMSEGFGFNEILRVKANMTFAGEKNYISGFHTDFLIEKVGPFWSAILYLEDTDGGTVFENGKVCECVKNRLIVFPGYLPHSGMLSTDSKTRLVINFNWLDKNEY